jgi:hypothetical protein
MARMGKLSGISAELRYMIIDYNGKEYVCVSKGCLDPPCDLVLLGAAAISIDTILTEPTKYLVNYSLKN